MRKIVRNELSPEEFVLIEASSGEEALRILSSVPDIKLMTLDVEMPGVSGFKTLEKYYSPSITKDFVKFNNHNLPIILVTSNDNAKDRKKAFDFGIADFVAKPFAKGELLLAVNRILKPEDVLKGLSVLVVDDCNTTRKIIVSCLTRLGVQTHEAHDGVDAFQFLKEQKQDIDLVVTDLYMKEMNGDKLCNKIKNDPNLKNLPVIFLSANMNNSRTLDLFKLGAADYLRKPFIKEELSARLFVHLERLKLNKLQKENIHNVKSLYKLKDEFLSVCSHDLRSPLNGILGSTELLLEEDGIIEEHKNMIVDIQSSGQYLLELINDLLDLGSAEATGSKMEYSPLNIAHIMDSCITTLYHTAKPKRIKLILNNQSGTVAVSGNENALLRIFNNLLSNAIKFSHRGGEVKVEISKPGNGSAIVAISDSGIGIPECGIDVLFDRFSRSSQTGTAGEKGTGLGLSITKELVEAHHGSINVVSTEGEGSVFTISLPLLPDSDLESDSKRISSETAEQFDRVDIGPQRILLAEDNEINIKIAVKVIEKLGHTVAVARNGREALELYEQSLVSGNFDLIFMDMQLPIMDGIEASKAIRRCEETHNYRNPQYSSNLPIIAITANVGIKYREMCEAAGMNCYITKPIKKEVIRKTIIEYGAPKISELV